MKIVARAKEFLEVFLLNKATAFGLLTLVFMTLSAIFLPMILQRDPFALGKDHFRSPNLEYPLGTDDLGRDILTRVFFGIRVSLSVGLSVSFVSTVIGIVIGSLSGYVGGIIDDLLMRFTEAVMVIPRFFLALVLVAITGPSIWNVIFVLSVLGWASTARLTRAEFLSLKEREYVLAAKAVGISTPRIVFEEILPNALPPVIVNSSLLVGTAILMEAGLSFLGLGDPNLVTLGSMLYLGQLFLRRAWWIVVFPGLTMFFVVLSINLVGDGLNNVLDPRRRGVI